MAAPNIAIKIGEGLLRTSQGFMKAVRGSVGLGRDSVQRTGEKIKEVNSQIKEQDEKQEKIKDLVEKEIDRQEKEGAIERKKAFKGRGGFVDNVVKKPLASFWKAIQAWVISNLPKILEEIDIFVKKIKIFVASVKQTVTNIGTLFSSIGNIADALWKNLKEFDFNDSKNRLATAMEEYELASEDLDNTFKTSLNVWNKTEEELDVILADLEDEKNINQILRDMGVESEKNTTSAEPMTPAVGPGSQSGGQYSSLLDFIASGEGGYNSMNQGTVGNQIVGSTHDASSKLGKDLTSMTIGEIIKRQDYLMNKNNPQVSDYGIYAAGRYQIIPSTMKEILPVSGLKPSDKFSPENQDKLGIALITKKQPRVDAFLKGSGSLEGAMDALANEFASIPDPKTGRSKYGSGNAALHTTEEVRSALEQAKSGQKTAPQQTEQKSTQAPKSNTSTNVVDEFKGGMSKTVVETSPYGMRKHPIYGDMRMHKGIDLAPPGRGYLVSLKRQGRVARISYDKGYGNFVIIETGEYSFMFAHLAKVNVRMGESYTGQPIGEIGSTGTGTGIHLHYEVYKGNKDGPEIDPRVFLPLLSIGKKTVKKSNLRKMSDNMQANNKTPEGRARSNDLIASVRTGGSKVIVHEKIIRQTEVVMPA